MIPAFILTIEDDDKRRVVQSIYDLYYKYMMACAVDILKNRHDAQDAVQDSFYNITATYSLFTAPRFSFNGSSGTYLREERGDQHL